MKLTSKHIIHSLVDVIMIDPPSSTIHIAVADHEDMEGKAFTLCSLEIDQASHKAYPIYELRETTANYEDCLEEYEITKKHFFLTEVYK